MKISIKKVFFYDCGKSPILGKYQKTRNSGKWGIQRIQGIPGIHQNGQKPGNRENRPFWVNMGKW